MYCFRWLPIRLFLLFFVLLAFPCSVFSLEEIFSDESCAELEGGGGAKCQMNETSVSIPIIDPFTWKIIWIEQPITLCEQIAGTVCSNPENGCQFNKQNKCNCKGKKGRVKWGHPEDWENQCAGAAVKLSAPLE